MPTSYDPNSLWVALSEFGEGNIFNIYPKLLAELFLQEEAARQEGDTSEAETLVLPSDKEWRLQQYFLLVDMQKAADLNKEEGDNKANRPAEDGPEEWAPWNLGLALKNSNAPPPVVVKATRGPAWDIRKVLKAAKLVRKPPQQVDFVDEQEMRCVYSLIYDVFRYKSILDQSIDDVDFLGDYPQYSVHRQTVWLFLMELARRSWSARPRSEVDKAKKLLEEAGSPYKDIEEAVWQERVHFAAAIARIRIKNRAYSLSDLLPPHLKEDRISACVYKNTITGWVNSFKTKKVASLVERLHELGYSYSNSRQLCAGEYRFDRVCPRFITIRPLQDASFGQIDLVKDGIIVLQEREFCEGASTLCRALRANSLCGVVAQTHASSPRCSAYLAAQLRELAAVLKAQTPPAPITPELGKLVIFGAGDKLSTYVDALRELGIEASEVLHSEAPVCVLSDPVYQDSPAVTSALTGVVAVLATPPNSYSSVTDPIDLVCGRGGDLAILEVLTETEIDVKGRERVQSILEEQKKTLKTLMSKPQIQLILYETHSSLEAENEAQVTRAVAESNRLARERHMWLKRKHKDHHTTAKVKEYAETVITDSSTSLENTISQSDQNDEIDENFSPKTAESSVSSRPHSGDIVVKKRTESKDFTRPGTTKSRPIPEICIPKDPDKDNADVYVPNYDLFEVHALPNLGNGLDINYILDRDGCYLGLIQRKEITHLDAKYMIRVAEERGLFGGNQSQAPPPRRKRVEPATSTQPRRRKGCGFEVERIAAPTHASLTRAWRRGSAPASLSPRDPRIVCSRHARRHAAASAYSTAACTCDQRHRYKHRRASADIPVPRPTSPAPACRRPFPMAIHDLQLQTIHRNIFHPTN